MANAEIIITLALILSAISITKVSKPNNLVILIGLSFTALPLWKTLSLQISQIVMFLGIGMLFINFLKEAKSHPILTNKGDLFVRLYIGLGLVCYALGSVLIGEYALIGFIMHVTISMLYEVFKLPTDSFKIKLRGVIHSLLILSAIPFVLKGEFALIMFCVGTFLLNDVGAYFIGKYMLPKTGLLSKKLAPTVSPNKTLFASIGGVALTLGLLGIGSLYYGGPEWFSYDVFPCLLFVSLANIFGDLHASHIKREVEVKDFPGQSLLAHGGYLDRFDSWGPGLMAMTISLAIFSGNWYTF